MALFSGSSGNSRHPMGPRPFSGRTAPEKAPIPRPGGSRRDTAAPFAVVRPSAETAYSRPEPEPVEDFLPQPPAEQAALVEVEAGPAEPTGDVPSVLNVDDLRLETVTGDAGADVGQVAEMEAIAPQSSLVFEAAVPESSEVEDAPLEPPTSLSAPHASNDPGAGSVEELSASTSDLYFAPETEHGSPSTDLGEWNEGSGLDAQGAVLGFGPEAAPESQAALELPVDTGLHDGAVTSTADVVPLAESVESEGNADQLGWAISQIAPPAGTAFEVVEPEAELGIAAAEARSEYAEVEAVGADSPDEDSPATSALEPTSVPGDWEGIAQRPVAWSAGEDWEVSRQDLAVTEEHWSAPPEVLTEAVPLAMVPSLSRVEMEAGPLDATGLEDLVQETRGEERAVEVLEAVARMVRSREIVLSVDAGASPAAVLANILASLLSHPS